MADTSVSSSTGGAGGSTATAAGGGDNGHPAGSSPAATPGESLASQTTAADALRNEPSFSERMTGLPAGDVAQAGAQGATALAAREGIGAQAARQGYTDAVSKLDPTDRAGRTAAKLAAREATPPAVRAAIEAVRPDTGPKPGSLASANKTNAGANALAGKLGVVGKANLALSVGLGAYRIANADNKVEETARVAGGALGGIVTGGLVGAQLGAMGANPVTIGVGAVLGGIVGGIAGEAAVNQAMGWVKSWF
ncbi:hypothetical protein BurJ1DRAFT_0574 [Burkholderiales bacterium JOSHI_001]|nr:hypothetical protein BurJ1DRAFT_0574 [Burkholderiales bacterium JOSHI_001]